jgi:hypothetical protein
MALDESPAFFRDRGADLRAIAAGSADRTICEQLLRLVQQYEALATKAERIHRF